MREWDGERDKRRWMRDRREGLVVAVVEVVAERKGTNHKTTTKTPYLLYH